MRFISILPLALILLFPTACQDGGSEERKPKPPNIIFIFADDLGYGDLGCFGSTGIATPHIDSIARAGMLLSAHYTLHPICSPSRAALLTGQIPARHGLTGVFFPKSKDGIPAATTTLPEVLQSAGYNTAMIGKWHLGSTPGHLPLDHGFQSYFGIPYSNDMDPLIYMRDSVVVEEPVSQSGITAAYTREAIDFLHKQESTPFFLYLAHSMPHIPIEIDSPGAFMEGKSRYEMAVQEIDRSTGEILNTLRDQQIERETVVVFTSDNGPWLGKGTESGTAGDLRNGKFSSFEGGCRVPAVICGPGVTAGESDIPTSLLDWLPTFATMADAEIPSNLDGRDIGAILQNQALRQEPIWYFENSGEIQALRYGGWKLKRPHEGSDWNGLPAHDTLLFNLQLDPGESQNMLASERKTAAALSWMMDSMQALLPDSIEVNFGFW